MNKILKKQIKDNYHKYMDKILNEMGHYIYRKERYNVDFTIALYLTNKNFKKDFIEKNIRDTDKLLILEDNMVCVLFDYADIKAGIKASENLLSNLEPIYFNSEIFISIINSNDVDDEKEQVRKALNILIDEIDKNFNGIPLSIEEEDEL
jgi:hypothetical protein